ncbi:MAG: site-specific integrase [Saprospiraceae bacterium]|nr:site-specific integrase [Saprospiraceae bacterium]
MSVSVLLYTSKTLKNGEHPIMIRVIQNRKTKYISLGKSSRLDLWDIAKQLPKRKNPHYQELVNLIEKKRIDARKLEIEMETEKPNFSLEEYEVKFRNKTKEMTVFKFFDEVIENMVKAGRIGNSKAYKDAKNSFSNFRNGKDFNFNEMTPTMLTHYEQYMRERKVTGNTVGAYCRVIRAVYNKAIMEGYALKSKYPFVDFKVSKLKSDVRKRAISYENIQKIAQVDLSKHTGLENSRNYFLFSYYCIGMNFNDMAKLQWSDVEDGRFQYTRSKTGKKFNLKMVEPAVKIVDYYRDEATDTYVFPILHSERHTNPVSINNRIKKSLKRMNKDLKEIAELVGIKTKLTTYVARHSAATVLKKLGYPTSVIQELLGHGTEAMTQKYLDETESDTLDLALEGLV